MLEYPRTIWASADGTAWTKSALPFTTSTSNGVELTAHANAIAGGPQGFVVVGAYDHTPCPNEQGAGGPPPCDRKPISWTSPDGRTWTSSIENPIPADGSKLATYSEMVLIWAAASGWDVSVETRSSVMYQGNTLLHSVDGLSWTRGVSPPIPAGADSGTGVNAHGGAGTPTGERVVWQFQDVPTNVTLSSTEDGVAWSEIPAFDGTDGIVRFALAPQGIDGGPWLLAGARFINDAQVIVWWRSDDLVTWQSGPMIPRGEPMQALFAVAREGGGFIALGSEDADSHPGRPSTWLSEDGMTWINAAEERGRAPMDGPMWLAHGPAGLIGIGTTEDGSTAWLGIDRTR